MGTNISTVTENGGHFVLSGVPGGTVTLKFQGPGVNATLVLSGLVGGQTLTISVQVAGSDAHLEPDDSQSPSPSPSPSPSSSPSPSPSPSSSPSPSPSPEPSETPNPSSCAAVGAHAEVEGDITAIGASSITVHQNGDDQGDATRRKRVLGDDNNGGNENNGNGGSDTVCNVTATTVIRKGDKTLMLSDLSVGNHVHVSGTGMGIVNGMCTINATEIKLQGGGD